MDILSPPTTETSSTEPTLSQSYIENQMQQMNESIMNSIGSMFDKFQQSEEQRFLNLSEEINQLKGRMDLYDLTTNTTQGPSTSSNENLTSEIKAALQQGIDGISFEVKAQASSHVDHVVGMYICLFQNVLRYIKPRLYSTLFSSKVGQTAACARTSSNIECDMRAFQEEVWDSRYAQGAL